MSNKSEWGNGGSDHSPEQAATPQQHLLKLFTLIKEKTGADSTLTDTQKELYYSLRSDITALYRLVTSQSLDTLGKISLLQSEIEDLERELMQAIENNAISQELADRSRQFMTGLTNRDNTDKS